MLPETFPEMSETLYKIAVLLTVYKICCLVCGVLFCFFGFRLFLKGIYPNDGQLEFEGFKTKLYLKRIGPGIFFAVFGAVIICVAIFQPLNFEQNSDGASAKNYSDKKNTNAKTKDSAKAPFLPDSLK